MLDGGNGLGKAVKWGNCNDEARMTKPLRGIAGNPFVIQVSSFLPDSCGNELGACCRGPAPVCCWAGWAGVEDSRDFDRRIVDDSLKAFFGEGSDADHPFGLDCLNKRAEMRVAGLGEGLAFEGGQLVGRVVFSAGFHKDQRTVVGNEMLLEEVVGRVEPLAK